MGASPAELAFLAVLAALLVAVAGFFGWREWQVLRRLRTEPVADPEDRRYHRAQARRRLLSSALLILLAVLLVGSYLIGQERQAAQVAQGAPAGPEAAEAQRRFISQYGAFWIIFALILLTVMSLALADILAIRRYARRHYRQIQADRREMIEQEFTRIRGPQRNGH